MTLQQVGGVVAGTPQTQKYKDNSGLRVRPGYPNPFNAAVVISFDLDDASQVRASVYDILGRPVADLIDDRFSAGTHNITWMGDDNQGRPVASGMYFVRVQTESASAVRKVMLIK